MKVSREDQVQKTGLSSTSDDADDEEMSPAKADWQRMVE